MKNRVQSTARIPVQSVKTELLVLKFVEILVQSTETPNHRNLKLCQRDIAAPVQLQRLNQNAIDQPVSAMKVHQKDILKRNVLTTSKVNTTRFHQILVRFLVRVQRHLELIGRGLALLQRTTATLRSSEREITVYIMLRIDHQNLQTMVIPGEDFDHHHQIIEEDTPGVHLQVLLGVMSIDGRVDTHPSDTVENDRLVQEEATGRLALGGVIALLALGEATVLLVQEGVTDLLVQEEVIDLLVQEELTDHQALGGVIVRLA